ncbi:MAG: phosphatase PAP2 family protein [Tepidiformaceae bacterium]
MQRSDWIVGGQGSALAAGAALLVVFAVLTAVTQPGGSGFLDRHIQTFSDILAGGRRSYVFTSIEPLGSPGVSVVLTGLLAIVVARVRGLATGLAVIIAMGAMTAVEGLLRIRVGSIPWNDLAHFLTQPHGHHLVHSTYPSGHTARLGLVSGMAVAALVPGRWRTAGLMGVVLITAWIAIQRVAAHQHTGTDVVGGALLGWGTALLFAWLVTLPAFLKVSRTLTHRGTAPVDS